MKLKEWDFQIPHVLLSSLNIPTNQAMSKKWGSKVPLVTLSIEDPSKSSFIKDVRFTSSLGNVVKLEHPPIDMWSKK